MNKQCQYAILMLVALAKCEGYMRSDDICAQCDIPLAVGRKTLQDLARRGMIDSRKGLLGGFRAQPSVTIAEVIRLMDPSAAAIPFGGPAVAKVAAWRERTTIKQMARTA